MILIGREPQIATSSLAGNVIDVKNQYFLLMKFDSPTLVANLWDVTDKDIDKFSQSVFEKLNLSLNHLKAPKVQEASRTSIVAAVAQSRDVCKLKYLTGAAPVVYGIPFYL